MNGSTPRIHALPEITEPQSTQLATLSCLVAYNEFGGYCIPKSSIHRPAAQRVLQGRVWERETISCITENTGDGDVIHAGTYFGDFLPALSSACSRGATIWAFEPNPENFRCATITMILNNLNNVRLTNAGLGSAEGTALMTTIDGGGRSLGGASRIVADDKAGSSGGYEDVQIVAIDDVVPCHRNVSILHLDVEGYEVEALSGAQNTIKRCLPMIILETLPEDDWLARSILSLGYKFMKKTNVNSILAIPE